MIGLLPLLIKRESLLMWHLLSPNVHIGRVQKLAPMIYLPLPLYR